MQAQQCPRLPLPSRRKLVEEHLPLARTLAARVARTTRADIDSDELCSYACIGLIQASRGFRPELGKSFANYSYSRVKGAILDGIASLMPVPRGCYRRRPDAFVHISDERDFEAACHEPARAEAEAHTTELATALRDAVSTLPGREQELLYWHFVCGLSVAEAARKIGHSRSWGCRARARALTTLRTKLAHLRGEY